MTGSIACYKACGVISSLTQKGYSVKVVLSPSSLQFIGAATIEGLTSNSPITDMYASGSIMDHIHLDRWADLILVAPATANYINKIAYGLGDDLLTTLFLAHDFKKPFLIAPAMNTMMYLHPTTQASLEKIKSMHVEILETASGVLACGEVGYGRLLDPQLIVQEVESRLNKTSSESTSVSETKRPQIKKITVLITSGGTTEPIDDVRSITNKSTGKTAAFIADQFLQAGLEVDYLHAVNAAQPRLECEKFKFETFDQIESELKKLLSEKSYDFIIHAAAVSDYSVVKSEGKISSSAETIQLNLKRNPKLLNEIKKLSPHSKLIGFKLTSKLDTKAIEEKVSLQFQQADCDLVVHNDLQNISSTAHSFNIYSKDLKSVHAGSVQELSIHLFNQIIKERSL